MRALRRVATAAGAAFRRPPPPPGRCARTFLPFLAPVLFLALLAAPQAVLAQNLGVLVSNNGKAPAPEADVTAGDRAQAFTTGTHVGGYTITRVDISMFIGSSTDPLPTYTVELWSDSGDDPGSRLVTLTNPTTLSTGINEFTVPDSGFDVDENTRYHVVWNVSDGENKRAVRMRTTNDLGEDPDGNPGTTGWSLGNESHYRPYDSVGDWGQISRPSRITVRGTSKPQNDATLSALSVTDDDDVILPLDKDFARTTYTYSATLTHADTSAKVTAITNQAYSSLSGSLVPAGGTAETITMTSGTAAELTGLAVGDNVLTITATSADNTTQDYTLTITRSTETASNPSLNALALADADGTALTLAPDFASDTTAYTATLDHATPNVGVTATLSNASATFSTFGVTRSDGTMQTVSSPTSGTAATLTGLTDGGNTVQVEVTSEDGTQTRLYEVTVTVPGPPTAAIMPGEARVIGQTQSLMLTGAGMDPDGGDVTYAWTAMNASGDDVTSSVFVDNATDLAEATFMSTTTGVFTVTLTVTDDEGSTTTATMMVTVLSADATLGALTVTDSVDDTTLPLRPAFAPGTSTYTVQASNDTTSAMVTATTSHENATLFGLLTRVDSNAVPVPMASGMATELTGLAVGDNVLRIGVTAEDSRTFMIYTLTVRVVDAAARRAAVKTVLAATGQRALMSALDTLGGRLGHAGPDTSLALAGQALPLGGPGPVAGASGLPCRPDDAGRHGMDRGGDGCGLESRGVTASELLASSAFLLALGASEEGATHPASPRWALWGRADSGAFAGNPGGVRYEGRTRTLWLGMDARAGSWVAGLAASQGESETSYGFESDGETGTGHVETTLTTLYPYGRWSFGNGLEARGFLGAGAGEARHRAEEGARDQEEETAGLAMWMASVGVRQTLLSGDGFDLAAQGDLGWVRLETANGEDDIDEQSADGWRGRAGLEASRRLALEDGASLEPFVEAVGRYDGGDGATGSGVEVSGGVRYGAKRVQLEARGRWLATHSEEGTKERGVSVAARWSPDPRGRGLSFALTPRWGAATGGADALWGDEMPRVAGGAVGDAALAGTAAPDEDTALDAALGYGFGVAPEVLVTPFVEAGVASGAESRRVRLGARYQASQALALEVSGERRENATADPGHALGLDVRVRF